MPPIALDDLDRRFLIQLYEQTQGDAGVQVSMYEIGEAIGVDRDSASRIAQHLMGFSLVDVRTLAGDIGITEQGLAKAESVGGGTAAADESGFVFSDDPVLHMAAVEFLQVLTGRLKTEFRLLDLDFEQSEEVIADIKTIEAQLASPRPKTAILRECFRSVKGRLDEARPAECLADIDSLLQNSA